MPSLKKISYITILIMLVNLFITAPASAIPPLPSSFYGEVKYNTTNIPDGTLIQALIDGQVYAETYSLTYQGNSVFAIDIPGDNSSTPDKDGGREGDVVNFTIGGVLADQTGTWHGGTNTNLDISASASNPIITPSPTRTPLPTQTAIIQATPTATQNSAEISDTPEPNPADLVDAPGETSLTDGDPLEPDSDNLADIGENPVSQEGDEQASGVVELPPDQESRIAEITPETGFSSTILVIGGIIIAGILISLLFLSRKKV